jgi:hypothetical protein
MFGCVDQRNPVCCICVCWLSCCLQRALVVCGGDSRQFPLSDTTTACQAASATWTHSWRSSTQVRPFSLWWLRCALSRISRQQARMLCLTSPAPFTCAGVFVSKNADTNQSPYCKFDDQRLQTFTSCLFLAGALPLLDLRNDEVPPTAASIRC